MRASIHEQLLCSRQVLSYNTFLLQSISLNHNYRRKDFMAVYLCYYVSSTKCAILDVLSM